MPEPDIAGESKKRQALWLEHHGAHEWEKHDLPKEALEESVDLWTYLGKERERLERLVYGYTEDLCLLDRLQTDAESIFIRLARYIEQRTGS